MARTIGLRLILAAMVASLMASAYALTAEARLACSGRPCQSSTECTHPGCACDDVLKKCLFVGD